MSELKTQFGELVTADLHECTLTFEVGKDIIAQAGKYAIVPISDYETKQANGVDKSTEQALPIRDVNGCWVVSNTMRPTQDGIYTTIDSHGIEGETLMDTGHWIIRPDRHPVHLWLKPNCR
jgi:hypothetical protein